MRKEWGWHVQGGSTQKLERERKEWTEDLSKVLSETSERLLHFTRISDLEIKGLYTPEDIKDMDYFRDIGFTGVYPFVRGVLLSM